MKDSLLCFILYCYCLWSVKIGASQLVCKLKQISERSSTEHSAAWQRAILGWWRSWVQIPLLRIIQDVYIYTKSQLSDGDIIQIVCISILWILKIYKNLIRLAKFNGYDLCFDLHDWIQESVYLRYYTISMFEILAKICYQVSTLIVQYELLLS